MYRSKYLKNIKRTTNSKPISTKLVVKHDMATDWIKATDWAGIYCASISERPSVSAAQFKRTKRMRQLVDDHLSIMR